jgi:hypothetical protein
VISFNLNHSLQIGLWVGDEEAYFVFFFTNSGLLEMS